MDSPRSASRSALAARSAARHAAFFVAYLAAGVVGLRLATIHESASPVWPPTGIAIAGLVLLGLRAWPVVVAGAFLFNFFTTRDVASSIAIAGGNGLEGVLGAWFTLRALDGARAVHRVRSALFFVLVPGLAAPLASATIGVTALAALGLAPWSAYPAVWLTWWLGDVGGALVVAPAALALAASGPLARALRAPPLRIAEALCMFALAALVAALAFLAPSAGVASLALAAGGVLVVVAWAALRFGPRELTLVVLVLSSLAVWGTLQGAGPFSGGSANEALLLVQVFVASLSASALVIGGGAAERLASPASERPRRIASRVPILAVALGVLPVVVAALPAQLAIANSRDATEEQAWEEDADAIVRAFEKTLDGHAVRLAGAKALFESSAPVSRDEFAEYVAASGWFEGARDLQAVAFDRVVARGDVDAFEARVRADESVPLEIRERFRVFPAGDAEVLVVVDYLVPFHDNLAAWGFDAASDETRARAVREAIDTGLPISTARVDLVQSAPTEPGFLILQAAYEGGDPGDVEARRETAMGLLVTVHRSEHLAHTVLASLGDRHSLASVSMHDAEGEEPEILPGGVRADDANPARIAQFTALGRGWHVAIEDRAIPVGAALSSAPWFVLLAGGALSTAFTLAASAFESTTRRAHALAAEMRREQQAAETQFSLLMEAAPDAMIVADARGRIVLANAEAVRLFGYPKHELLSLLIEALVPRRHASGHEHHRQAYALHAARRPMGRGRELSAVRKDGSEVAVEIALSPMETGTGLHVIATVRDISDRREIERERRDAYERREELARLEEINRFKTQFINTAAHELRTPLLPLRTQVYLLMNSRESPPSAAQQRSLDVLKRNLERLGGLVEDLLTVARTQAGRLGVETRPEDLGKIASDVAETYRAAARLKGIQLDGPSPGSFPVLADARRIHQVLSNLMSNALKFTPTGGSVAIELVDEGDRVRARVADTGFGIAKSDVQRLFIPFVQVHDTAQVTEPGSGLGLYICRQYVELHGGEVGVESAGRGKGTVVWFTLPKAREASA